MTRMSARHSAYHARAGVLTGARQEAPTNRSFPVGLARSATRSELQIH